MRDADVLLAYLASRGFERVGDELRIPDRYRHLFMDEGSVALQDGEPSDFVLERILRILGEEDPSYFRLALGSVPDELREGWPGGDLLLAGCFQVTYEAHKLVDRIHCGIASFAAGRPLTLDEFYTLVMHATPAKIYMDGSVFDRLVVELRGAVKEGMRGDVEALRAQMARQLDEEVSRVREYYSMLKKSAPNVEEYQRYEKEEELLVSQYMRRLHPSALRVRAVPIVLAVVRMGE